jgi:hypothetical protein
MFYIVFILMALSASFAYGKSSHYWKEYGKQWQQYGEELGEYYTQKYAHPYMPGCPTNKPSTKASKRSGPEDGVYYGPTKLKNRTLSTVTINGPAHAKNVTIQKSLEVHGPLDASNLSGPGILSVKGFLTGTKINLSSVEVMGAIDLEESVIENLKLYTRKSSLTDSQITSLKIKDKKSKPATIKLHGSTVVKEIHFASGKGIVLTDIKGSIDPKAIKGGTLKMNKKK